MTRIVSPFLLRHRRGAMTCAAGLLVYLSAGCGRKSEITVYRVPKEANEVAPGLEADDPAATADAGAGPAANPIHWTAPAGWTEEPATGFRKGSFNVAGPDGQKADVSVVTFPSSAGGLLSNVNRWRGQLQLGPITEEALKEAGSVIPVHGHDVYFTDLVSEQPILNGAKSRMLGGVLPLPNETWFFKMTGPDALVESQKESFQGFLQSLAFDQAAGGLDVPVTPPPGMTGAAVEAPPAPAVHYDLPPGWAEKPLTPMRVASFRVPGGAAGDADASIVFLAGAAGDDLSNINRWRGQIGLDPVNAQQLDQLTTHVRAHGHDFILVDLLGNAPPTSGKASERLLAAILYEKDQSWFVKMTGPDALVAGQRDAFVGLLQSLTIP